MKQRFFFLTWLIPFLLNAQSPEVEIESTKNLQEQMNHMFAPLDLADVSTGVLYDKGITFFDWQKLDGSPPR